MCTIIIESTGATDTCSKSVLRASPSARLCRLLPQGRKNDMAYFTVLLRYIHQNPVKAGIVEKVKDYEFSSWGEYDGTVELNEQ